MLIFVKLFTFSGVWYLKNMDIVATYITTFCLLFILLIVGLYLFIYSLSDIKYKRYFTIYYCLIILLMILIIIGWTNESIKILLVSTIK
jgi:hypothetical protein